MAAHVKIIDGVPMLVDHYRMYAETDISIGDDVTVKDWRVNKTRPQYNETAQGIAMNSADRGSEVLIEFRFPQARRE